MREEAGPASPPSHANGVCDGDAVAAHAAFPPPGSPSPGPSDGLPSRSSSRQEVSPPPDDPSLDPFTLEGLLNLEAHKSQGGTARFSMDDIMHNRDLARAARRELEGQRTASGPPLGPLDAAALEVTGHEAEVARQWAVLQATDAEVAAESRVSKEMAALVVERLDAGKRALEVLLKVLVSLVAAEQAYAVAMAAAARLPLAEHHGGQSLQALAAAGAETPALLAATHRSVAGVLQRSVDAVRRLLQEFSISAREIGTMAGTVQHGVEAARRQLAAAFLQHRTVCEAADTAVGERLRPRASRAGPDQDPWATEGRLVAEHQALHAWQDKERAFVKEAFVRLQELEARRLSTCGDALQELRGGYPVALAALSERLATDVPTAPSPRSCPELAQLARVAESARDSARALADKQAENMDGVCQELFCSPEIIRQGEMAAWDARASAWTARHFVLTRAGFLHWFTTMDEARPLDSLNLARCQFEQGEAPIFNLVEGGNGGWLSSLKGVRKLTLQAPSIDDCCEWAIALREAIALSHPSPYPARHASM